MAAGWWPGDGTHAVSSTAPDGAEGWCSNCQQWCGGKRADHMEIRCACCCARAVAVRASKGSPGAGAAAIAVQFTRAGDRADHWPGVRQDAVLAMRVVAPQVHVHADPGDAVPSVAASLRQALRVVQLGYCQRS